jgi:hypothetical protein
LRSFWYHFLVHLTSQSTVVVCYYPQDMGALSVTNVLGNLIGKEQLTRLQAIMRSKPNLVSLCGIADDATEADLSGLGMDADDAIVLASELPDKGALSSLNLASNCLCGLDEFGDGTYDASGKQDCVFSFSSHIA